MRASGGKVLVYEQTGVALNALLYNFDIGVATLKPEHVSWIMTDVTPFAQRRNFRVTTIGFASRSVTDHFNIALQAARQKRHFAASGSERTFRNSGDDDFRRYR